MGLQEPSRSLPCPTCSCRLSLGHPRSSTSWAVLYGCWLPALLSLGPHALTRARTISWLVSFCNFNSGEGDRKKEAGVCLLPQSVFLN